ncbi:hypothetical protein MPSEU_000065000 [Mayamaea pseudoterrestris]|nr:hypothetical protein MPSEU_000063800 [Mayamaea pseudoterrestris]GKY90922.1 hypothetical protein MPSEU_000065000 [Mayamaea pseudoterrestris]
MNFTLPTQTNGGPTVAQQQPQQQQQHLFGLVVNGCPVRTDFAPVDASGQKFALRLHCPGDLPAPLSSISEIVLFLMPNVPLPPNYGVLVYWQITADVPVAPNQVPPSTGFELLGSLTPTIPSRVFATGWSEHEQLLEVSSSNQPVYVTIGVALEPLQNVLNVSNAPADMHNRRLMVAQTIAYDLFTFMQSFDTGSGGSNQMVVPKNIFDRWFQRFEAKFRRDPNFMMRKKDS